MRTQERAELAARVHDSVLQTPTLIQRNPGDARRLARRQERELRAWRPCDTLVSVDETGETTAFTVNCPHCHKSFSAPLIEGSAARYRGFKCPHCRLFVPAAHGHGEDEPLARDPDAAA